MSKDLKDIFSIYESILQNRKFLFEADISGIDELVYNPATKAGGTIGHGYDGGKKVEGITWDNHDNHLHIGFTNKQVAMDVIDYADSLGLKTTENPYAKKDPNAKVDNVHSKQSFHYRVFEGEPKVGAGVDISGDPNKITELIKWIEEKYVGKNYSEDKITDENGSSGSASGTSSSGGSASTTSDNNKKETEISSTDPILANIARGIGSMLGLKENFEFYLNESFGKNITKGRNFITIPGSSNPTIKSAIDGQVFESTFVNGKYQITIKSQYDNYYLRYGNLTTSLVKNGESVSEGQPIGKLSRDENAEVIKLDKSFYRMPFDTEKFEKDYTEKKTSSKTKKSETERKSSKEREYYDPAMAALMLAPFSIFKNKYDKETGELKQKRWASPTDPVQPDPWIKDAVTAPFKKIAKVFKKDKEEKIQENIEKIKKLLK